jgi:hypothetical protein
VQSEDKLAEARYFLGLLNIMPQDTAHEREFMYNVSAFLSSWRSVFDIMLYDYADKFRFGFSRDEEITERDFEIAARVTNNTQGLSFLRWWRQQINVLARNPLWTKRKIIVHRGYPPTMHVYTIFVSGSIATSSSMFMTSSSGVTVSVSSSSTSTTTTTGGSAIPTTTTTVPTTPLAELRFLDFQDRSVADYCGQALQEMENIVNSAIQQFGR